MRYFPLTVVKSVSNRVKKLVYIEKNIYGFFCLFFFLGRKYRLSICCQGGTACITVNVNIISYSASTSDMKVYTCAYKMIKLQSVLSKKISLTRFLCVFSCFKLASFKPLVIFCFTWVFYDDLQVAQGQQF